MTPRRLVLLVVLLGTLARLVLAATVGLGIDESYTITNARSLQLSYYDHPPLSFWMVHAVVTVTGSEAAWLTRLPFILAFAGTTWLIYRLAGRAFGEAAGGWAALLLNLSPVFGLTGGGWILPDGPLMLFLAATALLLHRLVFDPEPKPVWRLALAAGATLGLACLSKYHGFLFGGAILLFLATARRRWLAHPALPAAAAVTVVVCLPLWLWSIATDWASFRFQLGRAGGVEGLTPLFAGQNLAGQILYVLPWIWGPLVVALLRGIAAGPRSPAWFFVCLGTPPILLFSLLPLFGERGLPHWQAPGYLMLFPLLGALVAKARAAGRPWVRPWLVVSVAAPLLVLPPLAAHVANGWLARLAPGLAEIDPTVDLIDWTALRRHVPGDVGFVVVPRWLEAGKVGTALGPHRPVLVLTRDPRNFAFAHDQRDQLGQDALIVGTARSMRPVAQTYARHFDEITPLPDLVLRRGGREVLRLKLFRARNFHTPYPLPFALDW